MRNSVITAIATCLFVGVLYGHGVNYSPNPMNLTFGGQDGTIAVVIVGDEPSPDCEVRASATTTQGAVDLVSVVPASPQPAPNVILNVHVLRQPQGSSESVRLVGRWISVGIPAPPCYKGETDIIAITVTVNLTAAGPEPMISSVVNGASFLPGVQENCWVTIAGSNLSSTTRTWKAHSEIINGNLPTSLDGVSVSIDGKPASMYFIRLVSGAHGQLSSRPTDSWSGAAPGQPADTPEQVA